MSRNKVLKLEGTADTYVMDVVDGEVRFGNFTESYKFDGSPMRGDVKGLDYLTIQHTYNRGHEDRLEDLYMPHVMDEGDRVTYICDLKGMHVVKNSTGRKDNLKFVVGAHINKENGNTAIMTYKVWMFEKGVADYMCEEYDDYATAVARYNEVAAEFDSNFGKYSGIKK